MFETNKHVETHSFSNHALGNDPTLVACILDVKNACAKANSQAQELSDAKAALIDRAVQELKFKINTKNFPVDLLEGGGGIALNMNTNEAIALHLQGQLSVDEVNQSQSTADVIATAYRYSLLKTSKGLIKEIEDCRLHLLKLSEKFEQLESDAYTCMQKAMPVSLGIKFQDIHKH